ncbi:hypothetical protein [Halovivax cerinus]|uniref:Uncharacterized protein n=1 Tax=Halovivax cerinus TaxID=1487865 RepID=A0ABD5NM56_9EURY|nr:hypothetical protein [Halovivax cerinus]
MKFFVDDHAASLERAEPIQELVSQFDSIHPALAVTLVDGSAIEVTASPLVTVPIATLVRSVWIVGPLLIGDAVFRREVIHT